MECATYLKPIQKVLYCCFNRTKASPAQKMKSQSKQENDPGIGKIYFRKTKRFINQQGGFNIKRQGEGFNFYNTYQYLTTIPWFHFLSLVVITYFIINLLFATLYIVIGAELVGGDLTVTFFDRFLKAYYFSVQTLTTVGYGGIVPKGIIANLIASFEALCGLLSFAMATGLLYGRFSKPNAKIRFSDKAIISPYQDKTSFQFKIINRRKSQLMDLEARVILSMVDTAQDGSFNKNYHNLELQTSKIVFFPLTWTIVHAIDDNSPLFNLTQADLAKCEAEFLILITGYDDAFNQIVHSRHSYDFNELVWNARFARNFHTDEEGFIVLEVNQIDAIEQL